MVLASELMVALKSATPLLAVGGTSLSPTMWAEMVGSLSLFALVEELPSNRMVMTANATLIHSLFISSSFRDRERDGQGEPGGVPPRPLKARFAQRYISGAQ